MTDRPILRWARTVLLGLVLITFAGCDRKADMHPTMTFAQAEERVERLIQEAAKQLPAGAELERYGSTDPVPCEGADGTGQSGQEFAEHQYKIVHPEPWPTAQLIEILDKYWKSRGYRVVRDSRTDQTVPTLVVEDHSDGTRISIKLYPRGNGTTDAYLVGSSVCVWPNGTPQKGEAFGFFPPE